jgi:predicted component of viral defense system (DUF524 family)
MDAPTYEELEELINKTYEFPNKQLRRNLLEQNKKAFRPYQEFLDRRLSNRNTKANRLLKGKTLSNAYKKYRIQRLNMTKKIQNIQAKKLNYLHSLEPKVKAFQEVNSSNKSKNLLNAYTMMLQTAEKDLLNTEIRNKRNTNEMKTEEELMESQEAIVRQAAPLLLNQMNKERDAAMAQKNLAPSLLINKNLINLRNNLRERANRAEKEERNYINTLSKKTRKY